MNIFLCILSTMKIAIFKPLTSQVLISESSLVKGHNFLFFFKSEDLKLFHLNCSKDMLSSKCSFYISEYWFLLLLTVKPLECKDPDSAPSAWIPVGLFRPLLGYHLQSLGRRASHTPFLPFIAFSFPSSSFHFQMLWGPWTQISQALGLWFLSAVKPCC